MVKDNKGRLWLGTSNGLSCFDTSTYKFRNYFLSDGLINSEYNRYSACLLKDGSLLMGGMNGIDYFHPDSVIDDNKKSLVQITDFKVFDKSIFPAQSYSLSHDENSITIEFAVMDFKNLSGDKFAYKLKGVDKDWVMLKNRNFATYSTLSPGHYHFLVKAVNSNGVWNEQAASIDFTIKTPWWRSWWFYSGCLLIVGILLGAFYRFRINQLKRLMALRTKISQDLHDEVGATLSGIAMYSHLIRRQLKAGQSEKVEYSLGVIPQSASEMVNKLSDIVWLVNPRHDSIGNIIQKLEDYATEMAMVKNIRMTSSVSDKIADLKLPMEARRNIYLLCKEAINNSIKYSNCSLLHLRVQMYDHTLEYELQDNGIGFNFHEVKRGNGLNNMEQRANEIGATLKIVSATGKGTRITLQHKISQ